MDTYLLIDCGYFKFFRLYAAKSWYKRAHEYIDDETMQCDEIFQKTLKRRCIESIEQLLKKFKINWENVIFCEDCKQNNIWRKSIFNEYKGTRVTNMNVKTGFDIIKSTIQELVNEKKCKYYNHPHLEADDIVALYRSYKLAIEPTSNFLILASDIDYYQILYPNTKLLRLDKRDAMKHFSGDPIRELKIKIIMGDKSDNIQSIIPKCGKKTAEKYLDIHGSLDNLFSKNNKSKELYERNQLIIDFEKIPEELKTQMITKFII